MKTDIHTRERRDNVAGKHCEELCQRDWMCDAVRERARFRLSAFDHADGLTDAETEAECVHRGSEHRRPEPDGHFAVGPPSPRTRPKDADESYGPNRESLDFAERRQHRS